MLPHGLLIKAAGTVFTGLVGVSAYELVRKAVGSAPVHRASVGVTELGLRGGRRAEVVAETARVKVAGVVSEARERIGNEITSADVEHTTPAAVGEPTPPQTTKRRRSATTPRDVGAG